MAHKLIWITFILLISTSASAQNTCGGTCGHGTMQEYWNGQIDCVCNLLCSGYGSACCDFYQKCFENPDNLTFNDFIGTWSGRITNDQTFSYDDPITITIEENGLYIVTDNPGWHLISSSYPGSEEVHYDASSNILRFSWIRYHHYACGGACYSSVPFQVMQHEEGELVLFYNNGSGPAPQANSLYLDAEFIPEPSAELSLASGLAFLCLAARRRMGGSKSHLLSKAKHRLQALGLSSGI